ncbi:MAG: hypothetical protein M1816_004237 [Peltula sp. TS41687]|nr:MAG: hypothetical protein M1816_004237 [Peltula sp. TS41687]
MREDDCSINATQILKLTKRTAPQQHYVLKTLRDRNKVVFRPAEGTHGRKNTWVSFQCAKDLCVQLGLGENLQPLLSHELDLQQNRSITGSKKVESPCCHPSSKSSIGLSRSWFENQIGGSIPHIANQVANRNATIRLREKLRTDAYDAYDIVRGSKKHQGTYADFEQVQQGHVASPPARENPADPPHMVPVLSLSANANRIQTSTVAGQPSSEESPEPDDSMFTGDARTSGSEVSSDSDDLLMDVGVAQLYAPRCNISKDELPLQEPETNRDQCGERKISYYSDVDLEPRNSELTKLKLGLRTPSKTSSRYGSAVDNPSLVLGGGDEWEFEYY